MRKYEWNNFLHLKIQQFIFEVLNSNDIFRKKFFDNCNILQNIIALMLLEEFPMPSYKLYFLKKVVLAFLLTMV